MQKLKMRKYKKIKTAHQQWVGEFGFILPRKSGVTWIQQTGGVMCNRSAIEGVFIPVKTKPEADKILGEICDANYSGTGEQVYKAFERLKKVVHFDFEEIPTPAKYQNLKFYLEPKDYASAWDSEAFQWIKLTKFEPGWGNPKELQKLVGKNLVLIYPNCD